MPVLELVEHALNRVVIVCKRFAHAVGKAHVVDQLAQAFAREFEMV